MALAECERPELQRNPSSTRPLPDSKTAITPRPAGATSSPSPRLTRPEEASGRPSRLSRLARSIHHGIERSPWKGCCALRLRPARSDSAFLSAGRVARPHWGRVGNGVLGQGRGRQATASTRSHPSIHVSGRAIPGFRGRFAIRSDAIPRARGLMPRACAWTRLPWAPDTRDTAQPPESAATILSATAMHVPRSVV